VAPSNYETKNFMRVVLIGADNEENLGMAMIGASLAAAGHQVKIVGFSDIGEVGDAVRQALAFRPRVIGLAMQFQHRGWEFAELARRLRKAEFGGHLTAGGQFATMAHAPMLGEISELDSVVLYDGEETIVELVDALRPGRALAEIPGLAVRLDDGSVRRTEARQIPQDLDRLPQPLRYRPATRHFGVPFIPMSGGRGCWGKCAFCSITSFYRNARRAAGGLGLRLRSPASIAGEMAALTRREQSPCIFCFHDETLLLPRPADTLARISELTEELSRLGVEGYGLIGKCRPDCITEELAQQLAAHHVIRLYVGIENASQAGQDHLARRTRTEQLGRALRSIQQVGIFGCYNLLIFEPETTLDDVRENIQFIRDHAEHPVNFCRAEPYHGTPLWERLKASGELEGSWLGWDYHLREPKVELLFRVTQIVFRQRNFDPFGVANRSMSLGYMAKVLREFRGGNELHVARLSERASQLTRSISLDSAELLEQCLELVEHVDAENRDRIERETVRLGMRVAARDAKFHSLMDEFVEDAEQCASEDHAERRIALPARLYEALTGLALAGCVATASPGCGGETDDGNAGQGAGGAASGGASKGGATASSSGTIYYDSLPNLGGRSATSHASGGYSDAEWPQTGGSSANTSSASVGGRSVVTTASGGYTVSDMLPLSGGRNAAGGTTFSAFGGNGDPVPSSGGRGGGAFGGGYGGVDPVPTVGGRVGVAGNANRGGASPSFGGMVYDALPGSGGRAAGGSSAAAGNAGAGHGGAAGADASAAGRAGSAGGAGEAGRLARNELSVGQFRDTHTRRTVRSSALPLYNPPDITLAVQRTRDHVSVGIVGVTEPANTRWESRGKVAGKGLAVQWIPDGDDDQLRVAIRTQGGVTIVALRARDLPA
jgi:anaerobic magnesium-protoporphyrin IX monomethyl ester cyclase